MTIAQMHTAVKEELDKTSALELPAFEPEEIDAWLNRAIRKFVKTRYSGINSKGQSFEQTQKRIDDLRTLIGFYTNSSLTTSTNYPNAYTASLSSILSTIPYYWFALSEEAEITVDLVAERVNIVECSLDKYAQKMQDPYSEHILHYGTAKPLRLFSGTNVDLISDGTYSVTKYYLTYLKKPAEVASTGTPVNCDLPEHTHDEIVKIAANMMLENIEQPRYQSHGMEVATME